MNTPYKATFRIMTPHAVQSGVGFSKSPKEAVRIAKDNAWRSLWSWDEEHNHVSSIGGDYLFVEKGNKFIYDKLDL